VKNFIMAEYQGFLRVDPSARFAIAVSRFNLRISERLLQGARAQLERHGVDAEAIDVIFVPGAFELGGVVRRLIEGSYAAVIALGAVIRGETPHFEYVAGNVAAELSHLAQNGRVPVIFGVLTCNTMDQADDRADGKAGNKGVEAASAAIEMADLYRRLDQAGITH
jgi:6,7-dimethyl-8-ribityllumazine synthase